MLLCLFGMQVGQKWRQLTHWCAKQGMVAQSPSLWESVYDWPVTRVHYSPCTTVTMLRMWKLPEAQLRLLLEPSQAPIDYSPKLSCENHKKLDWSKLKQLIFRSGAGIDLILFLLKLHMELSWTVNIILQSHLILKKEIKVNAWIGFWCFYFIKTMFGSFWWEAVLLYNSFILKVPACLFINGCFSHPYHIGVACIAYNKTRDMCMLNNDDDDDDKTLKYFY